MYKGEWKGDEPAQAGPQHWIGAPRRHHSTHIISNLPTLTLILTLTLTLTPNPTPTLTRWASPPTTRCTWPWPSVLTRARPGASGGTVRTRGACWPPAACRTYQRRRAAWPGGRQALLYSASLGRAARSVYRGNPGGHHQQRGSPPPRPRTHRAAHARRLAHDGRRWIGPHAVHRHLLPTFRRDSMVKVGPSALPDPSAAPVPPQSPPGGSGQLDTPRTRPTH